MTELVGRGPADPVSVRLPRTPDGRRSLRSLNVATYTILVVVAILTLLPLVYAFFASFKGLTELLQNGAALLPKAWDIQNYVEAWTSANFGRYFINSLIVVAGLVVLDGLAASMLGYVMARKASPLIGVYQAVIAATLFVGVGTATLYPRFLIAQELGVANLVGVILIEAASISVIHSFLVMSFVRSLPPELEEAARVDGCGLFGTYWRIVLPLMLPILMTTTVLAFQAGWNNFEIPYVFTLTRPDLSTLVIGVYSLQSGGNFGQAQYNLMIAGAMMMIIPVVIVFLSLQRYFVRGLTEGALKG